MSIEVKARYFLSVAAAAFLALAAGCQGTPVDVRPNVILISVDSLRADHLGCYGYGRDTSPNIDSLARESLLYSHAFAPAPWTAPSHMTMFTAMYPSVHGVRDYPVPGALPEDIRTLPAYLRDAGYYTAGMYYGHFLDPKIGFGRGFDRYDKLEYMAPEVDEALKMLDEGAAQGRPFFMFLHVGDVHAPYMDINDVNRKLPSDRDMFDQGYDGPIKTGAPEEWAKLVEYKLRGKDITRDIFHLTALYDGAISHTDKYIGALVEGLKKRGAFDDTLIIFTSDHGEEFLEHGQFGHGQLYLEMLHVPLVVKLPRAKARALGLETSGVREELSSLLDLMPSILNMAGVEPGAASQGRRLAGFGPEGEAAHKTLFAESEQHARWLDFMTDKDRKDIRPEDWDADRGIFSRYYGSQRSVMDDNYHMVEFRGPTDGRGNLRELYHWQTDPAEADDIAAGQQGLVARYDKTIEGWGGDMDAARSRATASAAQSAPVKMTKEQMKELKALGYVQ